MLPFIRADGFGRFGGPAGGKDRYPCQQALLSGCEQCVAPLECGA